MGALLAVLAEVFDLAATTGLSVDSFLTGEAFTTAEVLQSHIANLVTYGGLSEAEALAAAEVSQEAYSALTSLTSNFPRAFAALAGTEALAVGSLVIGSATAAALAPYTFDYSTPIANLNVDMALQVWQPNWDDIFFPGVVPFARIVNYIDPANWAAYLYQAVGRYFWETAQRTGQHLIEHEVREVAREVGQRTVQSVSETLARYFENARWAVSHLSSNVYSGLQNYYTELGPLRPHQVRAVNRRLGRELPTRYNLETPRPQDKASAQYVTKSDAPGGAHQRVTPDWMLPLILGLYGDITPSWEATLEDLEEEEEEEENGPKKKKPRRGKKQTKANSNSSA
ncbi:VP2 minor capsid protein [Bat polyomavirus 6a]|uniref:Minor capsid protein n=1 Tax=Bat polyomavirus 6a TaxID=1623685 RepID=A0A0D5ZYC6_9POLY|nr:VP2 minor capsid protein [Bat polyomavirus 6a]BAQ55550.1 VP2 minor capsid protein [Bat polyomavirus 6a]